MNESRDKRLIIGIGNAGRQDDGLGWAFIDAIQEELQGEVELIYRYQLNVEDAELISSASHVVFVDARVSDQGKAFEIKPCEPKETYEFTTHALSPEVIVSLCNNLYQSTPEVYLLTIAGKEWELKEEGLSQFAAANLEKAVAFFKESFLSTVDS